MAEFDNTNSGALFNNKENKTTANHPDYKGSINVNGEEFWLSAWIKPTKKDPAVRFMSLSVQPKQTAQSAPPARKPSHDGFKARQVDTQPRNPRSSGFDDMNDDLPPF
jgi:hypothetical protein